MFAKGSRTCVFNPVLPALLAAVTLAVQPDTGALTLALNGKPVVTGVLAQATLKVAQTTVHQDSPVHDTVNVAYTDGSSAVYTYALDGNDCTLDYTLTNRSDKPQTINLGGWTCAFTPGATLKGTLPYWHWTYYQNLKIWHPSLRSPLGAVYAADAQTAAVFYSPSEWDRQSLLNATFTLGLGIPNPFSLEFHTQRVVAPGASDRTSLVMRVTNDLSQPGLHGGYKAFLAGKYPGKPHVPDPRPMAQFASVDQAFVTSDDPGGYNGAWRRVDRPDGVAAFLRTVADPLQTAHASGCLFWAPGGVDTVMYPPDFDVNLARVADTWPALVAGFHARGLRVGLCARAAETVDRSHPEHPATLPIDPDDARQVAALLDRFRHTARMGIDAYYLDTFGLDWASARLLPAIRQTVGPDVPIYTEYCTDATLPYADRYCEYNGGDEVRWTSPEQMAALRFLFPQSVWLCLSRTAEPYPKDYQRLELTPLIEDYLVKKVLVDPR